MRQPLCGARARAIDTQAFYRHALTPTPLRARRKLKGHISEFEQEAALVARQAKAELTASLRTREVGQTAALLTSKPLLLINSALTQPSLALLVGGGSSR